MDYSCDAVSHALHFHVRRRGWGGAAALSWVARVRLVSRTWCTGFGQLLELYVVPPRTQMDTERRALWAPDSRAELQMVLLHLNDGFTRRFSDSFLFGVRLQHYPRLGGPSCCEVRSVRRVELRRGVGNSLEQRAAALHCFPNATSLLLELHGDPLPTNAPPQKRLLELLLRHNHLTDLPPWVGRLASLQKLSLECNELTLLPEHVRQLSQLQDLRLRNNRIREIPSWIGDFQATLLALDMEGNRIRNLPDAMRSLQRLQRLQLKGNLLAALPEWIGELRALEELDIGGNSIRALPESARGLKHLRQLDVQRNEFRALPEWIGELGALTTLDASRNFLCSLPVSLRSLLGLKTLLLASNQLREIPQWLGEMDSLEELTVQENFLQEPDALPARLPRLKIVSVGHQHAVGCAITQTTRRP